MLHGANVILLYAGSLISVVWGIAHIVPTRIVVDSFESISENNRRIITMEWIGSGLTLIFIGLLVLTLTVCSYTANPVAVIVYRLAAFMLIARAVLVALTGARTPAIQIKICPIVKGIAAILIFAGSLS